MVRAVFIGFGRAATIYRCRWDLANRATRAVRWIGNVEIKESCGRIQLTGWNMTRNKPLVGTALLMLALTLLLPTLAALSRAANGDDDDYVLNLPEDPQRVTVIQRETRPIPGSHKTIRISLGDITAGQALLAVDTTDDRVLIERRSVRP